MQRFRVRQQSVNATNASAPKDDDDEKKQCSALFSMPFAHSHTDTNRRLLHRYFSEKNCRAAVVLPMRFVARAQRQRLHKIRMAFYSALVAAKTKELSRHYLHFYEKQKKNIHILFLVLFRCSVDQQFHNNNNNGQCDAKKFSANENEPKRTNEKREQKKIAAGE